MSFANPFSPLVFDISCTLVDVISCVPYEQHTFTYGPREFLHQIMTLISNLRGGQQRYMPLLVSKINDTMPNAPHYALSCMTGSSRTSEAYEDSQHSAPNSADSTPFGSPPLSATIGPQPSFFGGFSQELAISGSSTPSTYAGVVMSASLEYGDVAVSAPMQLFAESAMFQSALCPSKFEPD